MVTITRVLSVSFHLFYFLSIVTSTSWFHHGARDSTSSLAGASSSPRLSHITDLRTKHRKAAQLQNDKEIVDPDDLDEMDIGSGDGIDGDVNMNEASPSFLNKKINKIIRKLQLIAQLKNEHHYKHEANQNEINITVSSNRRRNTTKPSTTTTTTNEPITNNNISSSDSVETLNPLSEQVLQQQIQPLIIYGVPINNSTTNKDEPTKIDLQVNQIPSVNTGEGSPIKADPKNEKLQEANPAGFRGIGVYFAELFGTLVGLTYGAVLQLTSGGQSPIAASAEGL